MWQSEASGAGFLDVQISCQLKMPPCAQSAETASSQSPTPPCTSRGDNPEQMPSCRHGVGNRLQAPDPLPTLTLNPASCSLAGTSYVAMDTTSRLECLQQLGTSNVNFWSPVDSSSHPGSYHAPPPTRHLTRPHHVSRQNPFTSGLNDSGYSSPGGQRSMLGSPGSLPVFSPVLESCFDRSVLDGGVGSSFLHGKANTCVDPFALGTVTWDSSPYGDPKAPRTSVGEELVCSKELDSLFGGSGSTAPSSDAMRIALKEREVKQRLHKLRSVGCKAVRDIEELYHGQTSEIDRERHAILSQMAYDRTSAESINGHYNRKLLIVLERVEQSLADLEPGTPPSGGKPAVKKGRLLPKAAVKMLEAWYQENLANPYPSREVTLALAAEGGLTVEQIRKWFANKRNRSRPKPQ